MKNALASLVNRTGNEGFAKCLSWGIGVNLILVLNNLIADLHFYF